MDKFKKIYKRIEALEKRVAELEGQVQEQPLDINVPSKIPNTCENATLELQTLNLHKTL